ncbi:periplasmic heavy metal sensor, partial [candidate division WOR-3 bacterium]|nr:periplasmic heavy metal sensor [candidate division WOR-3 bacterium]
MKNRPTMALTLAALFVLGGWAVAQPEPPSCAACPGMAAGGAAEAMEPPPQLTAEQLQRIDSLRVGQLREVLPLQTDLEVKEIELDALWRAEELSANRIVAKVREISDIRGRLQLARVNHRLAMYRLLTPEQRRFARFYLGTGRGCGTRGMGRRMQGMGGVPGMRGCGGMRGLG